MKRTLTITFALLVWLAVIGQYILMVNNNTTTILETTVRFFSFFTILTNTLVALYFTCLLFPDDKQRAFITKPGTLTAVTVYITMVGSTYQVLLRHVWNPQGLQLVVNEMLHTVIPILVIAFWYLYESKRGLTYTQIFKWSIYPAVYFIYIMILGYFTDFYPYYFIDVSILGIQKALTTSLILLLLFYAVSSIFIFVGRSVPPPRTL